MSNNPIFKIIIEDICDNDPMKAVSIPTHWLCKVLIDLGLGKLRVKQGITIYSRYSRIEQGQREYYMSVVVYFDKIMNKEIQKKLSMKILK